MNASIPESPALGPAAFVGIDWADQKHDVVLRSAAEPAKVEHQLLLNEGNAVLDWINQLRQRFGAKGKVLVCLEQSRGALIYQLMGYELFELYPINPSQLANYRKAFATSGAKADRPDADLLSELVYCHRDRLKAWKPDDALTVSWPPSMRTGAKPLINAPNWLMSSRVSSSSTFPWPCRCSITTLPAL